MLGSLSAAASRTSLRSSLLLGSARRARLPVRFPPDDPISLSFLHKTTTTTVPIRCLASNVKISHHSSDNNKKKSLQIPDQEKEQELRKLQNHIRAHHQHGQYHEALNTALELLEATRDHFGKDHPATASAFNNVGLMHKLLGDYLQSKRHYHEALRIYGRVVGKDHASYAAALHNIGNLHRTQVHMDEHLSAMERLQLNEEAMDYLEEAWTIRRAELGEEHPHTVASRSNLGSTMASQVLQQQQRLLENSASSTQQQKQKPIKPSSRTLQRWEAAEEHLRAALETAIAHPRGVSVELGKDDDSTIRTLSAAAAAQNLAVFLKSRAMLQQQESPDEMLQQEAKKLYEQALVVRQKLLHESHPDLVATKYSLAELLSVMKQEEEANKLREEIMDSYSVTESEEPPEKEEKESSEK